jgi:hypothetical protein
MIYKQKYRVLNSHYNSSVFVRLVVHGTERFLLSIFRESGVRVYFVRSPLDLLPEKRGMNVILRLSRLSENRRIRIFRKQNEICSWTEDNLITWQKMKNMRYFFFGLQFQTKNRAPPKRFAKKSCPHKSMQ